MTSLLCASTGSNSIHFCLFSIIIHSLSNIGKEAEVLKHLSFTRISYSRLLYGKLSMSKKDFQMYMYEIGATKYSTNLN